MTDDAPQDGRARRSKQSRQRLIDAMIELIEEGALEPTAEQVAERAGLAMRTVFRHFADMESLYREIARRMHERAQRFINASVAAPTWQQTLHNVIERRTRLYEELMPMRLAADALRHRSPFLQQEEAHFVALARKVLREVLPAEVSIDRDCFEALDAALSYETWLRLRREQRLSVTAARRVMHRTVAALISGACAGRPVSL